MAFEPLCVLVKNGALAIASRSASIGQTNSGSADSDSDNDKDDHVPDFNEFDGSDDGIDKIVEMSEGDHLKLCKDTHVMHEAFRKLRRVAQAVINSLTFLLLAWKAHCQKANFKPLIPPRDVAT